MGQEHARLVEIYFTALKSAVRDRCTDETGVGLIIDIFMRGACHKGVQ